MLKMPLDIQKFAISDEIEFETASNKLKGKIVWSSSSNGSIANSSNVTAILYARRTDGYATTGQSWSGYVQINDKRENISFSSSVSVGSNWVEMKRVSTTVAHNPNGTGSANVSGSVTGPSGTSLAGITSSGGRTVGLETIDRFAVTNSVVGSNLEGTFKVNYTKYSSSWQYKLRISIPNVQMLERIDYNTSGSEFELSPETIYELFGYSTNSNNVRLGFRIETWNNGTKISDGNEVIITCKIENANPIFSDFEFEDINSTTLALTGDNSVNVNGYSTIRATISQLNHAEAQKRATMSKYRFIINDSSIDIDYGYNEYEDVSGSIANAQSGTYQIYAIDSRNNSTLVTKLASKEIAYTPINFDSAACNIKRNDGGVGSYAILTLSGSIWNDDFGQVVNSVKSVSYKFKKTTESVWIDGTTVISPTLNGNTFSFVGQVASNAVDYKFELNSSYDFLITIEDELSTKTIQLLPMASAIPNLSLAEDGVGIMCDYDENLGGYLQVGGEVYVNAKKIYPKYYYSRANLTITPDNDCYCEVDGVVTTWGYAGGTVTVSISSTNDPEVVYNYNGSGKGADTVSRDISAKALFKLSANVTYTISIQISNGGGETTRRLTAKTIDII